MIAAIRRALLRRQIRLQEERLRLARDMCTHYEIMSADAQAQQNAAYSRLQQLEHRARLARMVGA
jgi:hypothetical protein